MEQSNPYLNQIHQIRELMEKSTRFLSLSGLAGVSAGIFALLGTAFAFYILDGNFHWDENFFPGIQDRGNPVGLWLLADAIVVLVLSILTGFYFSVKRARKLNMHFWSLPAKRMLVNLFIPIITGGLLILILILRHQIYYIIPFSLIFYGLGLVNIGKISMPEINYLGFSMIILGLLAAVFLPYSLFFWALGFGVFHILYGTLLYRKYERKNDA